jgi:hypothetical protein
MILDCFMHTIRRRAQRGQHLFALVTMHPLDWHELVREIHGIPSLFFACRFVSEGVRLEGVLIQSASGVVPGWLLFIGAGMESVTMKPCACFEHDDCRANRDLGRACWDKHVSPKLCA